jgi:hypothetical protein
VNHSENREGITEWPVNDVPKVENALRLVEEQDSLGKRRLLPNQANDPFDLRTPGGEKPPRRAHELPERRSLPP